MKINSKMCYQIRLNNICQSYNENLNKMEKEHHVILGRIDLGNRNYFCNLVYFVLGMDILNYHNAFYKEEQYAPYNVGKNLFIPVLYLMDIL
jgi:hypothetical protein